MLTRSTSDAKCLSTNSWPDALKSLRVLLATITGLAMLTACAHTNQKTTFGPPASGKIYLYGERHGVTQILDRELELWGVHYKKNNMRDLFVELPYYSAAYLNLWMRSDNDDILNALYADWAGTEIGVPQTKVFYQKIKSEYPDTVFHGTDVGHQYRTTGARYLKYLEDHGQKKSEQYSMVQRVIAQGKKYYQKSDPAYRENMMSENFILEFDKLIDKDVMGIYGAAHTDAAAMNYISQTVPSMAGQLKSRYGAAVNSENP